MKSPYQCVLKNPVKLFPLKSETVEFEVTILRIEGFSVVDGKDVPNGIVLDMVRDIKLKPKKKR